MGTGDFPYLFPHSLRHWVEKQCWTNLVCIGYIFANIDKLKCAQTFTDSSTKCKEIGWLRVDWRVWFSVVKKEKKKESTVIIIKLKKMKEFLLSLFYIILFKYLCKDIFNIYFIKLYYMWSGVAKWIANQRLNNSEIFRTLLGNIREFREKILSIWFVTIFVGCNTGQNILDHEIMLLYLQLTSTVFTRGNKALLTLKCIV